MISSLSMDRENGESSRMNTEFTLLDIAEDEVLYNSLLQLTEKERTILQLIYIDQWTQTEVAKWFKDTPQNIGKTKKRALVKIKNELEKGRE
ncbi:sigma factor-like helix-turn-helix DNA-binding protein [Caldalkalibacillus mannanilyticus]|uniref:sigma factor-like helix-turn-helix DNA-binding protein n=1 Tax=Caldalkalibacillus mannanilyticus TaxID=1418 RepID=UPI0004691A14|nr:sigma factor-like helix-turn-helix DNA-binding protein [Caldalkalibacillus mannanilyticus]